MEVVMRNDGLTDHQWARNRVAHLRSIGADIAIALGRPATDSVFVSEALSRINSEALHRLLMAVEEREHPDLGVYAAVCIKKGEGEAIRLYPEVHEHLDECTLCDQELYELMSVLRDLVPENEQAAYDGGNPELRHFTDPDGPPIA